MEYKKIETENKRRIDYTEKMKYYEEEKRKDNKLKEDMHINLRDIVTKTLISDPVILEDGFVYEQKTVLDIQEQRTWTISPITREEIDIRKRKPIKIIREIVEEYIKINPEYKNEVKKISKEYRDNYEKIRKREVGEQEIIEYENIELYYGEEKLINILLKECKNEEMIKRILEKAKDIEEEEEGKYAIHYYIINNIYKPKVFEYLCERNGINKKTKEGKTILDIYIEENKKKEGNIVNIMDTRILKDMIKKGIDIEERMEELIKKDEKIINAIIENEKYMDKMSEIIEKEENIVNIMYKSGVKIKDIYKRLKNINKDFNKKYKKRYMINEMVEKDKIEMIRFMIEEIGVRINKQDENKMYTMHYACLNQTEEVIDYLIEKGGRVDILINKDNQLMHCINLIELNNKMTYNQKEKIINKMIEYGEINKEKELKKMREEKDYENMDIKLLNEILDEEIMIGNEEEIEKILKIIEEKNV